MVDFIIGKGIGKDCQRRAALGRVGQERTKMTFSEFVQRLSTVIRAGNSTSIFTRSILDATLKEEGQEIIKKYSSSSFKGYYNGSSISGLAKKINIYADPLLFTDFIESFEDSTVQDICGQFEDTISDINQYNAGEKLSNMLKAIITEAAGEQRKSPAKNSETLEVEDEENWPDEDPEEVAEIVRGVPLVVETLNPDLSGVSSSKIYMVDEELLQENEEEEFTIFGKFLKGSVDYYNDKKTILNPEEPRRFYDIYVCNDLKYHKKRIVGARDTKPELIISNGTIESLEEESRYIIVEGTGGIGKSMYLTHLFLSSAEKYEETGRIPVLISLKDYKETTLNAVQFIWQAVSAYDAGITQGQIITELENRNLILLLDGLDEIQTSLRNNFNADLEGLIKSYPGNTIVITSRPIYDFVAYGKFSLFDIQPLTEGQAVALIEKLDFWNETAKSDFIVALKQGLYYSHEQFASNPLLLTIMLMTYSSIGDVPGKMHVFYSKAYDTMARLHDATKGSFRRELHTKLSPEDFAKYFSQFCARTYIEEKFAKVSGEIKKV